MADVNAEICMRTGLKANARFEADGTGWAWYGSRYDTTRWVVLEGELCGALSDDEIDKAIAAGEIATFGSQMSGLLPPSQVDPKAAHQLFRLGVRDQVDVSDSKRPLATAPKVTAVKVGCLVDMSQEPVVRPHWHGLAPAVMHGLTFEDPEEIERDFRLQGSLWALTMMAAGKEPRRYEEIHIAARHSLDYAIAMENARKIAREQGEALRRSIMSPELGGGAGRESVDD